MSLVLLAWLGCVVLCDWRCRRVPNALVLTGAALAASALAFDAQPWGVGARQALMAGAAGFGALLVFHALGLMGAADVKFAAALGLWIGPVPLLRVWIGASLLAGLHALALLAWRRYTGLPRARRREIPYAAHMAGVTIGWMAWQHLTR